jgi:hypothetical protein
MEPALRQAGFPPKWAALFREMNSAFNRGQIHFQATPTRGRIGIDQVIKQLAG